MARPSSPHSVASPSFRAFARSDAIAAAVALVIAASVGIVIAEPTGRTERRLASLNNLREIGVATGLYRNDNASKFPIVWSSTNPSARPGTGTYGGWASWTFGGKYASPFWYSNLGGLFDTNPGYRPLNAYVPGAAFPAPTTRVGPNDPRRARPTKLYQDPADLVGHQQRWPGSNPGNPPLSCYNDIGTSYVQAMFWTQQQLPNRQGFDAGTRLLSLSQGVDPSRWVLYGDETMDIVPWQNSQSFQHAGNHGVTNAAVSLFYDLHADFISYRPGNNRDSLITPTYQLIFNSSRPENPNTPDVDLVVPSR